MIRSGDSRGQLVLLAGVIIALALVAMLTAYLQLGYQVDQDVVDRPSRDGTAFLDRAATAAARDVRGGYDWSERRAAVTTFRDRLDPRFRTLTESRVEEGIAYRAEYNHTVANQRARSVCPRGTARQFGDCAGDRGVVVQDRAGQTHVLAVAFDLHVTTPDSERSMTFVINATEPPPSSS